MSVDHAKVRREAMRWYLLVSLNAASPVGAYEELLMSTMLSIFPDATPLELRRQLEYLSDRALVALTKEPGGRWFADLTRYGTDICEYTIDCEPGIARPQKYW
ncbi:MAG: hypothetical protein ACT4PG_09355 [Panacagrimonas sp.]